MGLFSKTQEKSLLKKYSKCSRMIGILLLSQALSLAACLRERPTRVELEGAATPVFVLSGGGELASFSVYVLPASPEKMQKPIFEETPVWRIVAQPDWMHGSRVEKIGRLTYGVVPPGYAQDIPGSGAP